MEIGCVPQKARQQQGTMTTRRRTTSFGKLFASIAGPWCNPITTPAMGSSKISSQALPEFNHKKIFLFLSNNDRPVKNRHGRGDEHVP